MYVYPSICPAFQDNREFSITFQTANGKREFVPLLFTPAKKLLVSHHFHP